MQPRYTLAVRSARLRILRSAAILSLSDVMGAPSGPGLTRSGPREACVASLPLASQRWPPTPRLRRRRPPGSRGRAPWRVRAAPAGTSGSPGQRGGARRGGEGSYREAVPFNACCSPAGAKRPSGAIARSTAWVFRSIPADARGASTGPGSHPLASPPYLTRLAARRPDCRRRPEHVPANEPLGAPRRRSEASPHSHPDLLESVSRGLRGSELNRNEVELSVFDRARVDAAIDGREVQHGDRRIRSVCVRTGGWGARELGSSSRRQ